MPTQNITHTLPGTPEGVPYVRHLVKTRDGVNYAICGHKRTLADSERIIAALGPAWDNCPPCEPCYSMREVEREMKRQRAREAKALWLARKILEKMGDDL